MEEKTVARILQEGIMNGGRLGYTVQTNNPELLNAFLVGYMSLRPEERENVWRIVHDAFLAGRKLGICKMVNVQED